MPGPADTSIASLFAAADLGSAAAGPALFAALYSELHGLARRELGRQGWGVSLGATSLLHEAYLDLSRRDAAAFPDRSRFMAYAARVMRGLIVDYARNRQAQKRGGEFHLTAIATDAMAVGVDDRELTRVSEALDELAQLDPVLAEVVDLKYFCGFSFEEIAGMKGLSDRTVRRHWTKARAYLRDQPALLLSTILETEPPPMSDRAVDPDSRLRGRPPGIAGARATTPERLRRALRGDLDIIVSKALRKAPADRYGSVAALTDDLQRYLRGEPIAARAESVVYRAGRFVRRHRWGVAATVMVTLGLAASLVLVNRERTVAERRFAQVRELSNQLFEIDVPVRQLAGATRTRQVIVDTALRYLRGLADEVGDDPDLALDVGTAYLRVARVQGVPISANLGQSENAEQSLLQAREAIETVRRAQPANRTALLRAAQIAHDRMILAGDRRPDADALPLARESAAGLDRYLEMGPVPPAELESVLIVLNNVSNRFRIAGEFEAAQRLSRQGIALARASGGLVGQLHGGALLIGLTRIHRDQAELDEALVAIREAQRLLEPPDGRAAEVMGQTNSFVMALGTEAQLLGQRRGLSLGQPAQAVGPLQRGFDLLDPLVHRDPANADVRSRLSSIGLPLADTLADTDPARALAVYDHVLAHLAEIANNPRFRRIEVQALSGSARPLRALGRGATAAARLDAAFQQLRELGLFPADTIEFGSEADHALSALGDDLAARGELAEAIAAYQSLLDRAMAAQPRSDTDVADAHDLSRVYGALAALTARTGEHARAAALSSRREALWQQWSRQLPGNAVVVRQLAEAEAATRAAQP